MSEPTAEDVRRVAADLGIPAASPEPKQSGPSFTNNLVSVVCVELLALPFCFNGAEGVKDENLKQALAGFGIGLPIAIAGLTFPRWRRRVNINVLIRWAPLAILLAFIYFLGPDIYRRATERNRTQLDNLTNQVTEIQKRLRNTLSVGGLEDEDFDGRPLGFAWKSPFLDIQWIDPGKKLGISLFSLTGKNFGEKEIQLDKAYIISAIDGSNVEMKIAVPGDKIDLSEAGPVPPSAQFTLTAEFSPGTKGMEEDEFLKRWRSFFVVVSAAGQEIRHQVPESIIRQRFAINHPEMAPHVERRRP